MAFIKPKNNFTFRHVNNGNFNLIEKFIMPDFTLTLAFPIFDNR
jgi:hypothetical protein